MFLCEILTEQQQALPKVSKPAAQHVHVHVEQPKEKKSESVQIQAPVQAQPAPEQVQQNDPNSYGDEYDPELDNEMIQEVPPFQEILPIKRYYLIGRLKELKSRLDQNSIQNEDFETIIKFLNNFSYNSLVSLSNGIIPVVEDQLARLIRNE